MRHIPKNKSFSLALGVAATLVLSACSSSPFKSGLNDEAELRLEAMEASIAMQDVSVSDLEERVTKLEDVNLQIGKEINNLRERINGSSSIPRSSASHSTPSQTSSTVVAVHLASYRNIETTTAGWHTYVEKYGEQFNGLNGIYSVFTSGAGESFFRLKAGPFPNRGAANDFCAFLTANNDYCNVDKYEGEIID